MSHCHILIAALKNRGHRITPQREMIVEALAHSGGHVTAEDVYAEVRNRTNVTNIATVYRTLDLLVASGLASRIDLWDGRVVYTTFQHGSHIHLVCRCCGDVFNADYQLIKPLGEELLKDYHFTADLQHLSIVGVCAHCQDIPSSE